MILKSIKNIIFDLGGVIINIEPQKTYDAFLQLSGNILNQNNDSLDSIELFSQYERGVISTSEFIKNIQHQYCPNASPKEIIDAWNAILLDIPQERNDLLLQLKSKYNTFLLSNTNELHRLEIDKQVQDNFSLNGLNAYFQKAYFSYEMKLQKPEDEIFLQILKEQNILPEETLFIDDTPKHLNTANRLGIKTFKATSEENINSLFQEFN